MYVALRPKTPQYGFVFRRDLNSNALTFCTLSHLTILYTVQRAFISKYCCSGQWRPGPVDTHIRFTDDGEPIIPPEARPQKTSKKRIRTPAAHLKNIRSKNYNSGRVKKRPLETRPRRPRGKSLCFIVRSNLFMISV